MDKGKIVPLTQFYYKQVSKVYGILACTLTHTHTFSVSPSLLTFPVFTMQLLTGSPGGGGKQERILNPEEQGTNAENARGTEDSRGSSRQCTAACI